MRKLWAILFSVSVIYADINLYLYETTANAPFPEAPVPEGPWLTGPLLSPSPSAIPKGHFNFEPYLFIDNAFGVYNNHWHVHSFQKTVSNINLQFFTQIGLNSWMDLSILPQFFYNYVGTESRWRFGDLLLGLDFQLHRGRSSNKTPSVKFTINELFPTGSYQHLKTYAVGTDAAGGGTFATTFQFVFGYHWRLSESPYRYYLASRWSIGATLFTPVSVHGLNAYGGDFTTSGKVLPGASFPIYAGFEFTLTRNWALALDIANIFTCKTKFKGHSIVPVGRNDWSYTLSFAPAIEFNFNANVGLIGGVRFTAIGRNASKFINYVIALNWYV